MDFESVNTLNVRFNLLAGNLLPMTNHSSFSLFAKIYSVVTWLIELIFIITGVVGCIYLPIEKTLEDGMIRFSEILDGIIFTFQTTFMVLQILSHKKLIHQFIQKLNEMLHIADETMKNTVTATLQPVKYPIKYYWTTGIGTTTFWNLIAFLLMFEKDLFYRDDYIIPIAISKQPFSSTIFAIGTSFITISAVLMVIKKVSVDLYMMHLILMTTTQYKYISVKLAKVCQIEKNDNKFKENYSHELNRKKELEIRALCRHHRDVINIASLLKTLLSSNCTLMYVVSVFRLCLIGVVLASMSETSFWTTFSMMTYGSGVTVQLYILCSCVQQLTDASTEVTDKAFNENWYLLPPTAKRIFLLTIIADNLECKISTNDKFNLSLPAFMSILNQSYSITLLFLKMKEKTG